MRKVTIEVPYKSAGGIIRNHLVEFEVSRDEGLFVATPQLNENERRLANLPPQLEYRVEDGVIKSPRGNREGNFHVIEALVKALDNKDGKE